MQKDKIQQENIFYKIPRHILFEKSLGIIDLKVYAIIKSFMSSTGEAYPSNCWLSSQLSVDVRSIQRSIKKLCDLSIFKQFIQHGKRYLTDSFILHPDDADTSELKSKQLDTVVDHLEPNIRPKIAHLKTDIATDLSPPRDRFVTPSRQICHPLATDLSSEEDYTLLYNNINYEDKYNNPPIVPPKVNAQKSQSKPRCISSEVDSIFKHWSDVMSHPRAKLDDKRRKLISRAMKWGYSKDEIMLAISGCKNTKFNMGENDTGQIYDGLHVILKSSDNIDRFIRNFSTQSKTITKADKFTRDNLSAAQTWLASKNKNSQEKKYAK